MLISKFINNNVLHNNIFNINSFINIIIFYYDSVESIYQVQSFVIELKYFEQYQNNNNSNTITLRLKITQKNTKNFITYLYTEEIIIKFDVINRL